jgi:perosamine synthetase
MIPHSRPTLGADDQDAVLSCLRTGSIAQGALVRDLETKAAHTLGQEQGIATGSGTAALTLGLLGLGIGHGDEVVLPSYACHAVADAVVSCGASPVLCDLGEAWSMTPGTVERELTARTRAIIVVHTFGIAIDTSAFRRFGVPLVDDACQAFGAVTGGHAVGSQGDVACASFHATKLLTTGEGGIVATRDAGVAERIRLLRDGDGGRSTRVAAPMTDLQASLGLSQLARYPQFIARRREIAARYLAALGGRRVRLPSDVLERSVFFRFPLRTDVDFELSKRHYDERGIQVRRGVDAMLHRARRLPADRFRETEATFAQTLSIPIYPSLTDADVGRIVDATRELFDAN